MSASAATATAPTHDADRLQPTMLALLTQISAAAALIVFVRDLWTLSPLDGALLTAAGVGVMTYLVLLCGYLAVKRVMEMPVPEEDAGSAGEKAAPSKAAAPVSEEALDPAAV